MKYSSAVSSSRRKSRKVGRIAWTGRRAQRDGGIVIDDGDDGCLATTAAAASIERPNFACLDLQRPAALHRLGLRVVDADRIGASSGCLASAKGGACAAPWGGQWSINFSSMRKARPPQSATDAGSSSRRSLSLSGLLSLAFRWRDGSRAPGKRESSLARCRTDVVLLHPG